MGIFNTSNEEYARAYAEEAAMVDCSELIASALDASGMTRSELARALGVSKGEITERLRGERNITIRSLARTLFELGSALTLRAEPRSTQVQDWHNVIYLAHYSKRKVHIEHAPTSVKKAAMAAGMR